VIQTPGWREISARSAPIANDCLISPVVPIELVQNPCLPRQHSGTLSQD